MYQLVFGGYWMTSYSVMQQTASKIILKLVFKRHTFSPTHNAYSAAMKHLELKTRIWYYYINTYNKINICVYQRYPGLFLSQLITLIVYMTWFMNSLAFYCLQYSTATRILRAWVVMISAERAGLKLLSNCMREIAL